MNTSIARIFNTFGPRMRLHDGRALTAFMYQALAEEPLTVFGDEALQARSFCYVDDLVRGLVLLAESGEHAPVNLGSPVPVTLLELAEAVIGVTGSRSEIADALPVDDPQVRSPEITRARELLGWEPEISLEDGLRRLAGLASSRDGVPRIAGPSFGR